jgi:glucose-6-phosphate 1-dehydrogenase
MNHCLVFGARGHLAQSRIIPGLKKLGCSYTPISRREVANLDHLKDETDVVAYMAIPTHNFCENVEPYLGIVDPTYILEKPHGHSRYDFERIKSFIETNNIKVLYNDHYLGKDILQYIRTPARLGSIKIKIYETGDMNERVNYFDTVGIIGDMYQSHCVLLFATIIAKHLRVKREKVLREMSSIKPDVLQLSRSLDYNGTAPTQCRISMDYMGIYLEADMAKMVQKEEKNILINNELWDLNEGGCAYENVLRQIKIKNKEFFLKEEEIGHLWDHASIISC